MERKLLKHMNRRRSSALDFNGDGSIDREGCTAAMEGDVLSVFLTDTPPQIQKLRQAAERRDMTLLKATAHYLKGGALYVGAREFSELCSLLEGISENSLAVNALIIIENLETEFTTIQQENKDLNLDENSSNKNQEGRPRDPWRSPNTDPCS